MHNYVVTAHKPSWVTASAVGSFMGPDSHNLLVAKVNHIQVFSITAEGLICQVELPVFGTISVMQLMRQPNENQDWLIVLTEKYKLCIMKWNVEDARCHVISSGDTQDHCTSGMIPERLGCVDPLGRCIALYQCQRLLRIIPTAPEADKNAFNVRLLEDPIFDITFLYGCSTPTIAILYPISIDVHQLRTYKISVSEQDIAQAQYHKFDFDSTTSKLKAVPPPHHGILVFSEDTITYITENSEMVSLSIDNTVITAIGNVDNNGIRFLLGDHKGCLMMLTICRNDSGKCTHLKIETLGETSVAKSISYLDNGFVYIGSNSGDSQLCKLTTTPLSSTGSFVQIVQPFQNLGPIVDFCIVKGMGYLRQGQGQVVTCSGVGKDGSLRIIRNGIGITEHASEDLPGIKDLFSLKRSYKDRYHRYLVQSFMSETRILELISAEEMAPASLPGFNESIRTIHTANMKGNIIVQVTAKGINLIDCSAINNNNNNSSSSIVNPVWKPPDDIRISVANGNHKQLLIATTGGNLILLQVKAEEKQIVEVSHTKLEHEISCLNCNPLQTKPVKSESDMIDDTVDNTNDEAVSNSDEMDEAKIAVVGLWTEVKESPVVQLIALPSLKTMYSVKLGGDTIARDVVLATLERYHYLVVALGDGFLLTYSINSEAVANVLSFIDSGDGFSNSMIESGEVKKQTDDGEELIVRTEGDGKSDQKESSKSTSEIEEMLNGDNTIKREDNMKKVIEIISDRRKLSVGTKPADLNLFKSRGSDHIFASCDRPTVVYSSTGGGKLLVSNVNLQEVTHVSGFDTEAFPDCLAIATENGLHLGAIDEIQKLHITSIPLEEQPRRIIHLDSKRVFAVITERSGLDERDDEIMEHFIRIMDDSRFETLSRYRLNHMETGLSLLATNFDDSSKTSNHTSNNSGANEDTVDKEEQYLVVGTGTEYPNQEDAKEGRILIFRVMNGNCLLVSQMTIQGAVHSICAYKGMLIVSIGYEVRLLSVLERKDGTLLITDEDRHLGHILGYKLAIYNDYILVGDLLKSIMVLTCKKQSSGSYRLEESARDNDIVWVVASEILDDETYIAAEHSKHLYTFKRQARGVTDVERGRLERIGQFHLGTRINKIQHGSLVMQISENEGPAINTLIFGTIDGMLGVIARLKPDVYQFFRQVENAMATLIPGLGGLKHAEWREMEHINPPRKALAKNFVDGDLIERFLDLSAGQMGKVSAMVNVGVEELTQRVEEIKRLHGAS